MENRIKSTMDQVKYALEEMKKHMSALFSDVIWDTQKELKKEPEYNKKKISRNVIDAWEQIQKLEDYIRDIQDIYAWASTEPAKPEEPEEMPW